MGSPFTITSVSNYNSNPPSDDGSQTASNRLQWSTHITKIGNPIKTAFDASESSTSAAFGKILGGAGITTTATTYTVASSDQGKLVKVTASGQTITTPDATVVGSPFVFGVLNNSTGDITLAGNGTQTVDGNLTVTVPAGCGALINTDGSNWFSFGLNYNNVLQMPQGYLTPTSGTPVITGDVTAATSVYYTPFQGDRIPISTDGVTFKMRQFTEMTLTLVANHLASTLYDVFLFDNSGVTTMATGPAWNSSASGLSSRGTGAGTTELQRVHGLYTNKNSMTARNGSTTYTVAANEGLYVGTIYIDGSAGQVSCYRSYGQSRKWGVWNAYNRRQITMLAGDPTSSWVYNTNTIRPSNNNTANNITVFTGLPEEQISTSFSQLTSGLSASNSGSGWRTGIGWNVTNAFSGLSASSSISAGSATNSIAVNFAPPAFYINPPVIGVNVVTSLEDTTSAASGSVTYSGTSVNMLLTASYRG